MRLGLLKQKTKNMDTVKKTEDEKSVLKKNQKTPVSLYNKPTSIQRIFPYVYVFIFFIGYTI